MHQNIKWYCFIVTLLFCTSAQAVDPCSQWLAEIISLQGKVDTQVAGNSLWHSARADHKFCDGDKIRTGKYSRVTLLFRNASRATLDQNSTLLFRAPEKKTTSWYLELLQGSSFFRSRETQRLRIETPFINAVHQGTEFLVKVDTVHTAISVFDGVVAASNSKGEIRINKGSIGIAEKDLPPRVEALTIRPEDAVQWTLYYPPIVDYPSIESANTDDLAAAINAYQLGNTYQALILLDQIPPSQRNKNYLVLKSSLLLTAGSVDEAKKQIDKILALDEANSTAFALQSIIAVAKNRQDKAYDLAQKAVELNPQSAVAQIALSYAYQSQFKIELALKATQEAIRLSPDNALAWARLAELQLSTGERSDAMESAKKAQALNPKLDRTQTVLGFASLAQIDIDEATAAFTEAIHLNSADPLARLGLGLAKIRKGDIEEGTHDLETAVSLDPDNSIMRSYLGKAYYELKNDGYAATELAIAKEMDPKDPTPWFYDAIRKQTTNRPVEALHDMQKAIELNDNRGVYRSKLLLDEDAAARSANLSRIYQDLGFSRVALKNAWNALGYDSTNHSAHRFLSDAYIGQPRFRIARASELLQAQLLQPINVTPVQPQLTAENIGILNSMGPSRLSTGEYDPMFTSNGANILLNGAYGSNNTITDNAIISGVYDRLSLSLGQFHFQTDGFRVNDDYKQDIYNAFIQYAFSPDFNIQFEFKTEDVRNGDVPLRLNGVHRKNFRQTIEHDTARVGSHFRIDPKQDIILSAFYTTRKDTIQDVRLLPSPPPFILSRNTDGEDLTKGYQTEIQYLFHPSSYDITIGLGYLEFDKDTQINRKDTLTPSIPGFTLPKIPPNINQDKIEYFNSYLYLKQSILPNFTSILGLSFDSYQDELVDRQQLNPKFGLIWNPFDNLTFRGAAFRALKRPLASNQTIEPTQVAGFNQFFDGFRGTTAWQYSLGVDYQPLKTLFMGGEVNWRYTNEPVVSVDSNNRDRNEISHIAYLYWTPADWLSFRAEYQFEKFSRDFVIANGNDTDPQRVSTQQIPLTVNFFHDSGIFANLSATYIKQKVGTVTDFVTPPLSHDSDKFWTFDSVLGYRLPKKLGLISIEVRNIFNHNHSFQSVFDASGPQLTPFVPEREIFFKLSLFY